MVTLPLDLDDLMAQSPTEPEDAMPPGTSIGHVHLKVSDVPRALAFYRDALGFEEQAQLPSAAFVSAGGYHHHVGLNSWQSSGAAPSPESAPGLRLVEFQVEDADALSELERALAEDAARRREGGDRERRAKRVSVSDPDGQRLTFTRSPQLG